MRHAHRLLSLLPVDLPFRAGEIRRDRWGYCSVVDPDAGVILAGLDPEHALEVALAAGLLPARPDDEVRALLDLLDAAEVRSR